MTEPLDGATALIVPVPQAEEVIGAWRREHTEGGSRGMPSHVTVVSPWLHADAVDETAKTALASCAKAVGPFEFTLARLETFPQGVLFASVEPRDPFVRLIEVTCAAFPDHQPYGGEFELDAVIPHVTVAVASGYPDGPSTEDLEVFERASHAVRPVLPLRCVADEVQLWELRDARWRRTHAVGLG